MKLEKRTIYSILLLILVFGMGFVVAKLFFFSWNCPALSLGGDEIKISPLVNEQYFNKTLGAIENAKTSIDIVLYEFKWYDTNNSVIKLREALINADKKGIVVRIILDQSEWYGEETELSKSNRKTAAFLKENGIDAKLDSKKITTHDKLLIIDKKIVILGSHNWGSSALTKNNEASVLIENSAIAEYYQNYFDFLWASY
jgi:phosphatidylserine/phosphatidylglycerophosphate/cardiolipin synthase-like enzyme